MFKPLQAIGVATVLALGCSKATAPSQQAGDLRNLQVRQLGLTHQVCNWAWDYSVHDEVTFEIPAAGQGVIGQQVIQLVGGQMVFLGPVTECASTVTPCTQPTSICAVPSGQGAAKVRIYRRLDWSPQYEWKLFARSADGDTNTQSLVVSRPEGLPHGERAAIAYIDASKNHPFYSYVIAAYSPGVAGRRIRITREMWANGVRFSQGTYEQGENSGKLVVSTGAANWPAGPVEFVGLMEELDAAGVVIATDRKTVFVN